MALKATKHRVSNEKQLKSAIEHVLLETQRLHHKVYMELLLCNFLPLGKLWEKGQENTANRVVEQIQINL